MLTVTAKQDGAFLQDVPAEQLPELLGAPNTLVWVDICSPDTRGMGVLSDAFNFHPLAVEDATRSHERPKVDIYAADEGQAGIGGHNGHAMPGSYYFIVFYSINLLQGAHEIAVQPLNLFIGGNYLVTVHERELGHIHDTRARWMAPNSPFGNRVSALVYALLDAIVDDYFPLMDRIADRVEDLEDTIFVKFDPQSIQAIFALKKGLLNMRRVVAPERDVLNVLLRRELRIFSGKDAAYLQDIYDHLVRVTDNVDTYRDLLSSALDSYLSIQSNNLNQVMKILTMASIILMGNALIAGIYGMNFRHIPELAWRYGYLWALGLMSVVTAALIWFYRYRRWL
jgi:magnesium transporter